MVSLARIRRTAQAANSQKLLDLFASQVHGQSYSNGEINIFHADARELYATRPTPIAIISKHAGDRTDHVRRSRP